MKYILFLLNVLTINTLFSQNLVINSSFEEYHYCPPEISFDSLPCKSWYASNYCTPDYYNKCSRDPVLGVPDNWNGSIFAKDGYAYIGLAVFEDTDGATEHITGVLRRSLEKDSTYIVSFYVRFAEGTSDYCAKNIGAYLSLGNPFTNYFNQSTYYNTLNNSMPFSVGTSHLVCDTGWIRFEHIYKSAGGERFITLGLFWNNDEKLESAVTKLNDNPSSPLLLQSFNRVAKKVLLKENGLFLERAGSDNKKVAYYLFDAIEITKR